MLAAAAFTACDSEDEATQPTAKIEIEQDTYNINESMTVHFTGNAENVVPYALGPDEPLKPNNSIDNRRQNRRLEVYLVPGKVMVTKAQGGKID